MSGEQDMKMVYSGIVVAVVLLLVGLILFMRKRDKNIKDVKENFSDTFYLSNVTERDVDRIMSRGSDIVENFPQTTPMKVMYSDANGNLSTTTDLGLQNLTVNGDTSITGALSAGTTTVGPLNASATTVSSLKIGSWTIKEGKNENEGLIFQKDDSSDYIKMYKDGNMVSTRWNRLSDTFNDLYTNSVRTDKNYTMRSNTGGANIGIAAANLRPCDFQGQKCNYENDSFKFTLT